MISVNAPVFLTMGVSNMMQHSVSWRFRLLLVYDADFECYPKEQFNLFLVFPNLLWDISKAYIRGLTISYVSSQKRRSLTEQKKLELELYTLQTRYSMSPSDDLLSEL